MMLKRLFNFSPFHRHDWLLLTRTVSEPVDLSQVRLEFGANGQEIFEKASLGMTTYLWQCDSCGATKREECLGTEETPLARVLATARQHGTQYLTVDGQTYAIVSLKEPLKVPTRTPQPSSQPIPQPLSDEQLLREFNAKFPALGSIAQSRQSSVPNSPSQPQAQPPPIPI